MHYKDRIRRIQLQNFRSVGRKPSENVQILRSNSPISTGEKIDIETNVVSGFQSKQSMPQFENKTSKPQMEID